MDFSQLHDGSPSPVHFKLTLTLPKPVGGKKDMKFFIPQSRVEGTSVSSSNFSRLIDTELCPSVFAN